MSELESQYVKRGYWINHSQGNVLGRTITTDTRTGTIIVALLALCTSLALSHLWSILTFLYHQVRAKGTTSNGLYRQQQVLLRTLPTPSTLMADSIKLYFKWKNIKTRNAIYQLLPQTILGLLFVVGSIAAAIFSSLVANGSDMEVLVDSPFCGSFVSNQTKFSQTYAIEVSSLSNQYVQECYQERKTPLARCKNIFTRIHLRPPMANTPCPFSPEMCSSPALAFDSGLLDINDAFGFNMDDRDQVKYRIKLSCAILPLENRTRVVPSAEFTDLFPAYTQWRPFMPGEELLLSYFGSRKHLGNVTYLSSLAEANVTTGYKLE